MLKKIRFWNQINIVFLLILTACSMWTEKKPGETNKPLVQATPQPSIPRREANQSLPQKTQPQSIPNLSGYLEQGIARWYDVTENGAKTASGDIYDLYEMTAAHATLPLLSRVRVTNLRTGQRVIVTINDRLSDRSASIKLSYAAASQLGLVTNHSPVEIRGLPPT
ncbi:RlpA-like lipoprotein precursor [Thioploca ingrica]|uniref:RlpA-like lipoprotein n=1 Tax=Thioploca ingrica TaxID=40754 RepID=A0A090AJZ5_9GAMM|nr:RlpA-like lipoprotein precursor [Thioploca ingrica]